MAEGVRTPSDNEKDYGVEPAEYDDPDRRGSVMPPDPDEGKTEEEKAAIVRIEPCAYEEGDAN